MFRLSLYLEWCGFRNTHPLGGEHGARARRSAGMLAHAAAGFVERHLCHTPHVDPDGWQGAAASDAAHQPLVERPVVRNGSGADYISNPIWTKSVRTPVRLHAAPACTRDERRNAAETRAGTALHGCLLRGVYANASVGWHQNQNLANAGRNPQSDPLRPGSRASF